MSPVDASVFIVDDDELVRDYLQQLVKSVGLQAKTFSSAQAFLDIERPDRPCCLILDIRMPGLSGLELQSELINKGFLIPVIFITGYATVPMSVKAMKAGAVDFLQKPFDAQDLLDAIHRAIKQNREARFEQAAIDEIKQRIESLTLREYEILVPVVSGFLNKEIAFQFKMSESTVKTHRAHIMQKMAVSSFAELVRAAEKIGIKPLN